MEYFECDVDAPYVDAESTIYAATSQYQVILELAPELQADPAILSKIHVRATGGRLVPVDTVARIGRSTQALTVNHQGQLPSVTLSFNLQPGVSLGDAVDRIRRMEREMNMPASLTTSPPPPSSVPSATV